MSCKSKPRIHRRVSGSRGRGFVLIEVMVSVAILNIGLLGAFTGIRSAKNLLERAANIQEATFVLDELMSYFALNPPPLYSKHSGNKVMTLGSYQWSVEVTRIRSGPLSGRAQISPDHEEEPEVQPDLRKVQVKISWRKHGRTGSIEAQQLVVKNLVEVGT